MKAKEQTEVGDKATLNVGKGDFEDCGAVETLGVEPLPKPPSIARFPSSPLIIRVPFFLLFGFNKGTQKAKG